MTQTRSVTTKALSAYLQTRHLSLSAAIHMLGLSQKLLDEEHVSDDTLGRVARLYSMEPEQLAAHALMHEEAHAPVIAPAPAPAPASAPVAATSSAPSAPPAIEND